MISLKTTLLCAGLALTAPLAFGQQKPAKAPTKQAPLKAPQQAVVYQTASGTTNRLTATGTLPFAPVGEIVEKTAYVVVDPAKTFQTILGLGGALTDAAAETFYKLPKAAQQEFLQAYYSRDKGIGYSLGRTHIHSCDFSSKMYTYTADNDKALASFDVKPDRQFRIPFIKAAIAAAGGQLTVYASPWSPPAWMKTNNNMLQGGKLKPGYEQVWANYFAKFIKAYQQESIPLWGVTVQNEPMAQQPWESCLYTAEEERDFVKNFLGPTFEKEGLSSKKIVIWDHNRNFMLQRARVALDDAQAAKYIWGVGYHWYSGNHFANPGKTQEAYPNTNLLFTEGCNTGYDAKKVDDWGLGERYGISMMNDFNAGIVGWTDWNVLLDETGGPNHVSNFCYAPIHGDTKTGKLTYTNTYYYIGHFSKFVRPGARRILSTTTSDNLTTTAFLNTDGKIAVVIMNTTDKEQPVTVTLSGQAVKTVSAAHSISTLVI